MRATERAGERRHRLVAARRAIVAPGAQVTGMAGGAAFSIERGEPAVRHLVEPRAHVGARLHGGMTSRAALVERVTCADMASRAFAFGVPRLLLMMYSEAFPVCERS